MPRASSPRHSRAPAALVAALAFFGVATGISACGGAGPKREVPVLTAAQARESSEAFAEVAKVLRHPRCLNCHPSDDRPRVGDDARIHGMNVQRGPGNHGMPGQRCATCHQDANQDLAMVPGAPHWHLAPRSMGWVGLDDHGLALAITDPAKNGDRTLEALYEHMAHDPLVLWGWDPDPGRSPVPVDHADFVRNLRRWIDLGAVPPEPGTTSAF